MDICAFFAGAAIVFIVWAAIGHGIWLVAAAILRAFREEPKPRDRCPACARLLDFEGRRCQACGFQLETPTKPSLAGDLAAVERQLARLAQSGRLSDAAATTIRDALSNDQAEREAASRARVAGESPVDSLQAHTAPRSTPSVPAILSNAETPTSKAADLTPATPAVAAAAAAESQERVPLAEINDSSPAIKSEPAATDQPRGLAGILQSFMEEKNIRWAELVSALLIVGSSIGLVISLWATLKQAIPYFPVMVFLAATAALHGAGLYTLRRWRLKSTSRGLLLVSTLLVPLNVLAAIALNDGKPRYEAVDYAAVSLGLLVSAGIVFSAARILNRRNPWPMLVAVMGCAVGLPFIGRLCGPQSTESQVDLLFAVPFGSVLLALVAHVLRLAAGRSLTPRRAAQSFRFVGIAVFSLAIACGLLSWKYQNLVRTLSLVSPFVGLIATAITSAGLVIHQRLTLPSQAGYRTAGTSLALGGAALGVAAVIFAWPRPDLLLEVGLINALALTILGWLAELPLLQVFATASLSLSCVVGFDWGAGRISIATATSEQLSDLLMEAQSALILTIFGVLADAVACLLLRTKSRKQATGHFLAGSCQSLTGVVIATLAVIHVTADQNLATAVFLLAALRWLAAARWMRRESVTGVAAALLLAALLHGFGLNSAVAGFLAARGLLPADPWTVAFLLHATICAAYAGFNHVIGRGKAGAVKPGDRSVERILVLPLSAGALITSALALPLIVDVSDQRFTVHGSYAFWAALIWIVVAVLYEAPLLVALAQVVATAGVVFCVTGQCDAGPSWGDRLLNPLFLNWQLGALALWSGLWVGVRRLARLSPKLSGTFKTGPMTIDRIVLGGVVLELAATCAHACLPGICAEFGPLASFRVPEFFISFVVLAVFGLGAILTAAKSMFPKWWHEATALVIAPLAVAVALLVEPAGPLWPGFPTPYGTGWGAGAWFALALTALAVVAAHWEMPNRATLAGLVFVLTTIPALLACRWDGELATASALRWTSAIAAFGTVVVCAWRAPISGMWRRVAARANPLTEGKVWADFRNAVLSASSFPILILTVRDLIGLAGAASAGPVAGSFFARLGPIASDVGPIAILGASFLVCAVTDRRLDWGIPATFLAQFAFGIFACHRLEHAPQGGGAAEFVLYFQEMGICAGLAAAAWLIVDLSARQPADDANPVANETSSTISGMLRAELTFIAVLAALLTIGATVGLLSSPYPLPELVEECGKPLGWLFFSLAAIVWCVARRSRWPDSALTVGALYAMAAAPLAAAALGPLNRADNWLSFHAAMSGWGGLIALATLAAAGTAWASASSRGWQAADLAAGGAEKDEASPSGTDRLSARARGALRVADLTLLSIPLIIIFAIPGELMDPMRPAWSVESMFRLAVCTTILAVCAESYARAYLSLLLVILGSLFLGLRPWVLPNSAPQDRVPEHLVNVIVFGAAVYGVIWLGIAIVWERRLQRRFNAGSAAIPSDQAVAIGGTATLGLTALSALFYRALPDWPAAWTAVYPLEWASIVLLALLAFGSLWKRAARHPFPLLYVLALIAFASYAEQLELSQRHFFFALAAAAAGFLLLVSTAWRARRRLKALGLRLGMDPFAISDDRVQGWLPATNVCIAALAIAIEFWVVLTFQSMSLRIGAALATFALAGSFALLATPRRRMGMQALALGIGAVAAVQLGWALMNASPIANEALRRTIWMMAMLSATTFAYGVLLVRIAPLESDWRTSIRRAAVVLAGFSIAALGLVLALELQAFDPAAGAPLSTWETFVVAAALIGLAATLIRFAVVPNRDPFLLTEQQRFLYVYASEAVAGLLFAHLYLTEPELFRHTLQPYWPLIVMVIAFCGTGVSELFRRLRVRVLAKPLEHTAAFLPLLPAMGFWLLSSRLNYSTALMLVGLLYLLLTLLRGSFAYSAAAAIAGNATLFALFHEHGVSLFAHPQMFVIPPCLTVLAAAQINKDRLGEAALSSIRYFALTTIYVSSTGEMFHTGIGESLWLPMVLAGLSVLGVLAGIMLRVRAFLYLGTAFLVLSMVSMVWHAARSIGHVWPWWAFLFTLGLALLTLFGVFEKKRPEMLLLIDRMRQWER